MSQTMAERLHGNRIAPSLTTRKPALSSEGQLSWARKNAQRRPGGPCDRQANIRRCTAFQSTYAEVSYSYLTAVDRDLDKAFPRNHNVVRLGERGMLRWCSGPYGLDHKGRIPTELADG